MDKRLIKGCIELAVALSDDERLLLGVMMNMATASHCDPATCMLPGVNLKDFEKVQDLLTVINRVGKLSEEEYQEEMVLVYESYLRCVDYNTLGELLTNTSFKKMVKLLPSLSVEDYILFCRIFCCYVFDSCMELRENSSSERPHIRERLWCKTLDNVTQESPQDTALYSLLQSLMPLVHV